MARLKIGLLGRFAVASEHGPFSLQTSQATLLAYLALARGRPVPRTRVAGTFWPDLPEDRARANLSTVTWRLRRTLSQRGIPEEAIRSSADALSLDLEICDLDVEQFRRGSLRTGAHGRSLDALARAVQVVDLYRGDLLEDWDVEWCQLEREDLKRRYLETLQALAEGFERRGRPDLALRYARQAAGADPFDEQMQRALIRLLALNGDRSAAVSQFHRFARLARSELGTSPDTETVALVNEIKSSPSLLQPGRFTAARVSWLIRPELVPLIGRSEERRGISMLLEAAAAGRGGGVLLVGEAGIGKSRLAEWAMEEWTAQGGSASRGRCVEFDEPVPYQPLLDALSQHVTGEDLVDHVQQYPGVPSISSVEDSLSGRAGEPGSRPPSWPTGKLRLFNWLRSRLDQVCQKQPLLVVIEDLQWADAGTVDFLAYLLGHAQRIRLAVLLTARPAGQRARHASMLERLSRHCGEVLGVRPLSDAETAEFVRLLLEGREIPAGLAPWVCAETEGNPLFVVETLRLLQQKGGPVPSGPGVQDGPSAPATSGLGSGIPDGVRSAVQHRLSHLDPAALRIAEIASVLGRSVDEELLGIVAKAGANRLSRVISQLLGAGVFERENAGYRFSHDKIRAVCYENLPARLRRAYHSRAAAALAQVPETPVHRLAWHQLNAGQWHLAAASWAEAGNQARKIHAYEEALRAYRLAATCTRRDTTRTEDSRDLSEFELLVKADEVVSVIGRPAERREIMEKLGNLCKRDGRESLRSVWLTRRALLEEHVGNFGVAADLAREAWALARSGHDSQGEVEALRVLAWALYRSGGHRRSLAVLQVALGKARDTQPTATVTLLWQAAAAHIALGNQAGALAFTRRARAILDDMGWREDHPLLLVAEGAAHKWIGRLRASRDALLKALQLAGETADSVLTARVLFQLATLDAMEGDLGGSLRKLRRALIESRTARYARTHASCLNEIANGIGRLIGSYDWAWRASAAAARLLVQSDSRSLSAMCRDSQAQLLLEEGRFEEAAAAVDEVLQLSGDRDSANGQHGPYLDSLTKRGIISLHRGDFTRALADLETVRNVLRQRGERLQLPDVLSHLALAYARGGDLERALSTSEEAVRTLTEMGNANYQPQRIFWQHCQVLEMLGREPRAAYLKKAVECIETQASSLSPAQGRRLRQRVALNREILAAWDQQRSGLNAQATI